MDKLLRTGIFFLPLLFSGLAAIAGKSSAVRTPSSLQFAENKGQWRQGVQYVADLASGKLIAEKNSLGFLMWDGAAVNEAHHIHKLSEINAHFFKISFKKCNPIPEIISSEKEKTYRNYFIGNDPSRWASNVSLSKKITYKNLWKGIDANFYGSGDALKYDFRVQPHADISNVQLQYDGVNDFKMAEGELRYKTTIGEFRELSPYTYQVINGTLKEVKCEYVFDKATNSVSFSLPNGYDANYELVIDPTLVFATYTGSTADNWGYTATYDDQENMYVGGYVNSTTVGTDYALTTGAFQVFWGGGTGANQGTGNGIAFACDMGISKFSANGTQLEYSTYIGGSDNETPHSLIVDRNNNLIIYGVSYSTDYPVSPGTYDATINGMGDIVVTKLNAAGAALLGSTFVGGTGDDGINFDPQEFSSGNLKWNYGDQNRGEVVIDIQNNIYIASCTKSGDFPTVGAAQGSIGGGQDGCIFKLNPTCQSLLYSTFIGGSGDDACYSLDLTLTKEVYVCGGTMSPNFVGTQGAIHSTYQGGAYDGFVTHLNSAGSQFLQTSLIGTGGDDQVYFVKLDEAGDVYFVGQTTGAYPVSNGVYSNPNSGQFIGKVTPDLSSHIYSTVFGNGMMQPNISPTAFLVDTCQNVYVSGWTNNSSSFNSGNCCPLFTNPGMGLPLSSDAIQTNTDGTDFYFFVVNKNAQALLYGSYYGGGGDEHVDGGTSRFDKRGVMYQAICAGCGGTSFTPTTPGVWSPNNQSSNCNLLGLKIAFNLAGTHVQVNAFPRTNGCVPLTVRFTSQGSTTQNLQWDFADGATSTLPNPIHTFNDTGVYTVRLVGIDSNSCNIYDTAYIDVIVRDDSLVANFVMTDSGGCIPLGVRIDAHADSTANFYWNFGDGTTANTAIVSHTYNSPGTFQIRLIVIDSAACNFSDTSYATIVTIDSSVNPDFFFNRIFHNCDSVQVILRSDYVGEDFELWDFGDGFQIANTDSVTHSYTIAGSYTINHFITDTDMVCKQLDTAQIVISLNPLHISAAIPDTGGCLPFSTNFTGNSGLVTTDYHWYFGDGTNAIGDTLVHTYNSTGIFDVTVVAIDTNACEPVDSSFAQITVIDDSAHADFQLNVLNDCDSNLVINLVNLSNNQLQYHWNFGDSTFSVRQNENHIYHLPATYTVTLIVIDTNRCHPVDSISKNVTMLPNLLVDFSTDNVCLGNIVQFTNLSNPNAQFDWNFDDSNFSNQYSPAHNYLTSGTYSVSLIIVDSSTCDVSDTVAHDVTVYQTPVADFYTVGDTFKFEKPVQFTNTSTFYNHLLWNFGDGDFSTDEETPVHTYGRIYDVTICLTASNDECADTICKNIFISFEKLIGVPNAFTPNGDGINDVVKIEGKGIVELVFRIYNRWGEKVFETHDKNIGWDGIYKGTLQEMDVFTYAADATFINGEQVALKGNITLLR